MKTTCIETARTLLADASPELRRAVGELLIEANAAGYNAAHGYAPGRAVSGKCLISSRELIEADKQ